MMESFELGPIRPPSEAYSLFIRATRNCPWNRCRFCPVYKGTKFELRPLEDIKQDIRTAKVIEEKIRELARKQGQEDNIRDIAGMVFNNAPNEAYRNVALWLYGGGESVFLQDANTLIMKTDELVEIINLLTECFPGIKRITSYARSKTAAKKSPEEMKRLHDAGLTRLHIGLESGYDPVLKYMDKGVTAAEHITGGRRVVESGISLCTYVLLGLGGQKMWRENAVETARVLNEIEPDYIRIRTLAVNKMIPLHEDVENGDFIRSTDEEMVAEEKMLLEHLTCRSNLVSDHITNLLGEIEGRWPDDKERLLGVISRFQALSPKERANFIVGRRLGLYLSLDDMDISQRHDMADKARQQFSGNNGEIDTKKVFELMEGFV